MKWGSLRHSSIVGVAATVDGGRHTPSLEMQTGGIEAKQCTDVERFSKKRYFSHLKKVHLKKKNSLYQFKSTLQLQPFLAGDYKRCSTQTNQTQWAKSVILPFRAQELLD